MHDLQVGIENIVAGNGPAIAVTGMLIVFAALSSLSVFISLLPRILAWLPLSFLQVPGDRPGESAEALPSEAVAAIAMAMHAQGNRTG